MNRSARSTVVVVLLAVLALSFTGCTASTGALGTPATPTLTGEPPVEPPTDDATPGAASPSAPSTSAEPSFPTPSPSAASTPSPTPSGTRAPSPTPAGTTIVRAYFVLGSFTDNEGLVPVLREVPETKAVATAAMRALLAGPNDQEMDGRPAMFTAIPEGTRLLGLSIKDGIATVNLSREFESGGGSASILYRLGQVVYTLTQFRTVDGVLFQLDGEPVTVFSGEGIILDHPVGREDYTDQLPAIFVDRPAWGASLGNPGRVSGLANVFEATFLVQVRNAAGDILLEQQVMASCGTGCWGTFRTEVEYRVSKAQYGTLRVFNLSAKDGTPEHVTEYTVWLAP
jgi:spore germination protein GerM